MPLLQSMPKVNSNHVDNVDKVNLNHVDNVDTTELRISDEILENVAQASASGDGAEYQMLQVFNAPTQMEKTLKGRGTETVFMPRFNQLTFGQPEVVSDFMSLQSSTVTGLASRSSMLFLLS